MARNERARQQSHANISTNETTTDLAHKHTHIWFDSDLSICWLFFVVGRQFTTTLHNDCDEDDYAMRTQSQSLHHHSVAAFFLLTITYFVNFEWHTSA